MQLVSKHGEHPTCGVVVEKQGDMEKICEEPAVDVVVLADPEDTSKIKAYLLVCQRHSEGLEAGKSYIFKSENDTERYGIKFDINPKEVKDDDASTSRPDRA